MKHLIIILFLIFNNCKNPITVETKTKNGIDNTVYEMWDNFTESNSEFKKDEIPESSYFQSNEADANRLTELILKGKKKTASGLYSWFKEANADLPKIGTKLIVTDFDGKARAIIEIKKVDTIPFNEISREYAELDMGTNIEPLKKWKSAYWTFLFTDRTEQNEKKQIEETLIVCNWFKTIWPKSTNGNNSNRCSTHFFE